MTARPGPLPRAVGASILIAVALVLMAAPTGGSPPAAALRIVSVTPVGDAARPAAAMRSDAKAPALVAPPGFVDWINITAPGAAPPPTDFANSVYDPSAQETVFFGGATASGPSNATWVLAGGRWLNVTDPSDAPPARSGASMDYDANMGGVLLFGGSGAGGLLGDTWLFTGSRWTNLTWVSAGPSPRSGAMMAFDPQPEENGSVLFGGLPANGTSMNDTWVWQGWSGWVPLPTTVAPPPVEAGGFAYDAADGYLLLYGGVSVYPCFLCLIMSNQTWELYAGQWWPTGATGPGFRAFGSMTFDAAMHAVVLFGGLNASFLLLQDTWTYAQGAWHALLPPDSPSARWRSAMSPDAGPLAPVLFGGAGASSDSNDTWVLEGRPAVSLSVAPASLETSMPVTVTATVGGGSGPYRVLVDFGDGGSALVSGPGPTLVVNHTYAYPGSFSISANLTDAFGVGAMDATPALNVAAGPAVSAQASATRVDAFTPVHFGAFLSRPGIPPLTYLWDLGNGVTLSGPNVTDSFPDPGTYLVTLNVTDGVGGVAQASVSIAVAALPAATLDAAPIQPVAGDHVSFFANVTGGTAPYGYAWDFGDGNRSGAPDPVHAFERAGSYTVNLWVNDSSGGSSHKAFAMSVAAAPTVVAGSLLSFWVALGALVAIGAVAAALLVLTLRRKPPTTPEAEPEANPVTSAPEPPKAESPEAPKFPEDEL